MKLDFEKLNGLVPAIIQDANTNKVLMLGFMNPEAYEKTVATKLVTFYSRTKNRLWTKGEESGNFLDVVEIIADCDNDTLLIKANPRGPVCHKGTDTCFEEKNSDSILFLDFLQDLICKRKIEMPEGSYTTKLFNKGINKIAQKVGEEAVELVIEAKDNNDDLFLNEAADLMYHLLVLLSAKNYKLSDVVKVLEKRHK
jgi:phosphoribosyl-AMP cyclohydrolase / phosphoribosyl-ATP pyrophosphohydrolase